MKMEKANSVLRALSKERIGTLTKEALIKAFNDDGISDLEGAAEHILRRIRKDIEVQKTEPRLIDFAPLGKRTPSDVARDIVHVAPEVPFILDGVQYDPREIRRFDGRALIFMPVVAADGSDWLQLFPEEVGSTLASYFQMRQLEKLMQMAGFIGGTPPGFPPSGGIGPGQPTGDVPYPPLNPPGTSGPQPSTPAPQ
ncbi:hypothetical protein, partial [Mesorhizobium sp.]|uniref:hypothetical protein n=1 Tax=Mesorhizobium sp. TaxID=1871066 RepID=UPI001204ECE1